MSRSIRSILAALCACAGFIPVASHAVYLSPDGLGQALIFPYYTTRSVDGSNTYNTFVSIVNHTNDAKALRVRFREGKNGREVAGFNLFLGPRDTWVAALSAPPNDTLPTRMLVPDNSCAVPAFTPLGGSLPYLDFSSASYTGANTDGFGNGNDRTREGYVEAIEMSTITGAAATGITIGANGRPVDCGALNAPFATAPPTGGLSGTLTLLNVQSGLDFTANADALAQLSTLPFYRGSGDPYPDFNSAEVSTSSFLISADEGYRMTWQNGVDAVTAALMRQSVDNEFILDSATQSSTDWVVTFPTKRFYSTTRGSPGPFSGEANLNGGRSIPFELNVQARDGLNARYTPTCGFTCPPLTREFPLYLDWTTTVVGFGNSATANPSGAAGTSGALGSTNAWIVSLPQGVQNGSASLLFYGSPRVGPVPSRTLNFATGDLAVETARAEGLPAVGFAVRTFRNGSLSCSGAATCQGNYGGMYTHQARRSVLVP